MIRWLIAGLLSLCTLPVVAEAQTVSSMTDATLPLTNQEYLYIVQNGQPRRVHPSAIVPSGITIPNADLLGGLDNAFTIVTVGSNLSLASGILSMPVPTTDLLGGSGNAFTNIAAGTALEIVSGNLNLADTAVTPGTYTNTTLTVDQQGRLTAASSGSEACSDVTATAVIFSDGATCVGDYPNFVYLSTVGQLQIINKVPTANDDTAAAIRVESPDVNLRGAIQFGVSNLSGSGAFGKIGFQDAGDARDGPYTYFNTSDGSPILLGSEVGALGAPRVGINYIACMIADVQCAHGDLQIYGHRDNHESGTQYWVLTFGDGAANQGGFKIDGGGFGYMELGRSETSSFVPHIHLANNGASWINGFGTTPYLGVGTNAPGTMLDVNGDITTRTVTSCNSTNSAVQTDSGGKIVCGSISGGGGAAAPAGSTHAIQGNGGGGAFEAVGPLTNGQLAIGSTGAAAQAATITAGAGITITNGAGSITVASSGGGTSGLTLISTQTASGSAALQWTGLAAGKYRLVGFGLKPASNSKLGMQVGTGGGPTWNTGANHNNMGTEVHTGSATVTGVTSFSQTDWSIQNGNQDATGLAEFGIDIDISVANSAQYSGTAIWQGSDGNTHGMFNSGLSGPSAQVTAFQIFYESAVNIASGSASLYKYN